MHQHGSKYFAHRPPPSTLQVGSKGQNSTFSEHCHAAYIKLKRITIAAACKHIFCPYTYPRSLGWDQRSKYFPLKVVMLHIK